MKKAMFLFYMAVIMFLLGLVEAVSGFVLWLAFPHGGGAGRRGGEELAYWSMSKNTWLDIHDWVAVALVVVLIIHIALHWKWLVRITRQLFRQATDGWRHIGEKQTELSSVLHNSSISPAYAESEIAVITAQNNKGSEVTK